MMALLAKTEIQSLDRSIRVMGNHPFDSVDQLGARPTYSHVRIYAALQNEKKWKLKI